MPAPALEAASLRLDAIRPKRRLAVETGCASASTLLAF
eukprot:CAMPEP_0204553284 /NCGR_PEP_ID=MMETSP0661-20131031/27255_1 /ASSEMBLY_ACC=CAM_ASM_000606 /TAXON_ID=109239 /ORGANISM="Alexandrium margalefi, Strain AMGDE01CS-322" /LENGTH=37 /DNA_ID= /DNA_START= /DNA_END= /DNA_ORIENTATION=